MSAAVADPKIDLKDLEDKFKTVLDTNYDSYVLVDGAPVAPEAKVPALEKVLRKVLSPSADIKHMHIPVVEGKTLGYLFVECATTNDAKSLVRSFHGKKFDKNHTFYMDNLSSVGKIAEMDPAELTNFKQPELPAFKENPHFRSWLTDSQARDQCAVHIGDAVSVSWLRKGGNPKEAFKKDHMTEDFVQWSPLGTYLLTVHPQGAALHAGPEFDLVARFPHRDVCFVDFSPNENYLITGSRTPLSAPVDKSKWPFKETDEGNNIVIWDTRTLQPLRTFPISPLSLAASKPVADDDPAIAGTTSIVFRQLVNIERKRNMWPPFKWSHDSKFFARISAKDTLSIYETPSMALVDKKSLKVSGLMDFEFAPKLINGQQLIAYWTPEMQNQTARVCLIDAATKVTVRNRSLFNVAGCKLYWQNEAHFLAVKVDRYSKNKKTILSSLDIWRLNEKEIGVDVVDFKEAVTSMSWEPFSDRFVAFLYNDVANVPISPSKNVLCFFAPERKKKREGTWKEAYRFESRVTTTALWNPKGRFLTTLLKDNNKTIMEFWDLDFDGARVEHAGVAPVMGKEQHKDQSKELPINLRQLQSKEHPFGISEAEWDPSGRQLVTWNSGRGGSPGYRLWDISGELERQETKEDKFKVFLWRPRPPTILGEEAQAEVKRQMKTHSEKFDLEDKMRENEDSEELQTKRANAITKWRQFRASTVPQLVALGAMPSLYKFVEKDGKRVLVRTQIVKQEEKAI